MAAIATPAAPPDTPGRILDAAFACISDVGLGRTTVEDVARAAGLARQTIYRYFPSKDQLMMSLILREEEKFLDGVRSAFASAPGAQQAMEDATLFCPRFARDHPLLDRLLETDAETLLPYLTTRAGPLITRAREAFTQLLTAKAWVRADILRQAGDAVARIMFSYVMTPPDRRPEDVARDLARILALALTGEEAQRR